MAATVSQVATGIRNRLATISGLRVFNYQPEQVNPPIGFPVLNQIRYHGAYSGGMVEMDWSIVVVTGRWLDRTAHTALDGYLSYSGATSIRAAIEADKTLGGIVDTLVVPTGANISSMSANDAEFLKVEMALTVYS